MEDNGKFTVIDHSDFFRYMQTESIDPELRPSQKLVDRLWFSLIDVDATPPLRELQVKAVDLEADAEFKVWAEPVNSFSADEMIEALQSLIAQHKFKAGKLLFYVSILANNAVLAGKILENDPAKDQLVIVG